MNIHEHQSCCLFLKIRVVKVPGTTSVPGSVMRPAAPPHGRDLPPLHMAYDEHDRNVRHINGFA